MKFVKPLYKFISFQMTSCVRVYTWCSIMQDVTVFFELVLKLQIKSFKNLGSQYCIMISFIIPDNDKICCQVNCCAGVPCEKWLRITSVQNIIWYSDIMKSPDIPIDRVRYSTRPMSTYVHVLFCLVCHKIWPVWDLKIFRYTVWLQAE